MASHSAAELGFKARQPDLKVYAAKLAPSDLALESILTPQT